MTASNRELLTSDSIREWLVSRIAVLLQCLPDRIRVDDSFDRLGLDSATAVGLTLELEDWLGRPVDPAVFHDFNTIARLSDHLATGLIGP